MSTNVFRSTVCVVLISFINALYASESHFDEHQQFDTEGNTTPRESQARFAPDSMYHDTDDSHDGTATETAETGVQNTTFTTQLAATSTSTTVTTPPSKLKEELKDTETDGFITVASQPIIPPTLTINGGMYDRLIIPYSSMLYTEITLKGCTCFSSLDPCTFQNNPSLTHIILTTSQLNLRQFEEQLGEGCNKLTCIDLQGFCDVSVEGQPLITPERFAQLAHPDLLQRILIGKCELLISNPEHAEECYSLDDMKEKFLSSVLQLRSLRKAQDTLSAYQRVIDMLKSGVGRIDPQLAGAGVRAAITAYTGM